MALLAPSSCRCCNAAVGHGSLSLRLRLSVYSVSSSRKEGTRLSCSSEAKKEPAARVSSLVAEDEDEEDEEQEEVSDGSLVAGTDVASIREWEMDFCSRPIFDARGKKMWELLVCDPKRQLEFARFYPSNVINSVTLKNALAEIMDTFGLPKPAKVRFFRSQVQTLVTRACVELDVEAVPSQRCMALINWLQERYEPVYRQHPGFQEGAATPGALDVYFLKPLPKNLRGDKWAFVQLPFSALQEEAKLVKSKAMFGEVSLPFGIQQPSGDTLIPGVAVASARAMPLAAWTQSMELASLVVDRTKSCLVLSTGVSEQWMYASYRKSKQAEDEADAWEAAKQACGGFHFLAIQPSLDSDTCSGLWLLYDLQTSPI